jgi:agmatinase
MTTTHFPYLTTANTGGFLNSPLSNAPSTSAFAVAGIAWDGSVTHRTGARFGPQHIRRASHHFCDAIHPLFNVAPSAVTLIDVGDLLLPNTSLTAMRDAMMPMVQALIAQHHMLWLGGDHSITLPLLRAYRAKHGAPLALVHFDAHCDTWTDHFGEPSGHGTWVYEAIAEGLIDPTRTTQIGLRSSGQREAREYVASSGGRIFTARDLRGLCNELQLANVIDHVRKNVGNTPVYLSLDIDCLDPAYAPGTGTPEVGGLSTTQLLTLLEAWADLNWIGMDCCEVSPPFDHAEITSLAAATAVWTYLCGQLSSAEIVNTSSKTVLY